MNRRSVLLGSAATAAAGLGIGGYFYGQTLLRLKRRVLPVGSGGTPLDKIEHVVVLMLENRSFDNVLGFLKPKSAEFDGLTGAEFNPDLSGKPVQVHTLPGSGTSLPVNPVPDPGENFVDYSEQIFSTSAPASGQKPTMDGFVRNFLKQPGVTPDRYDDLAQRIMHVYTPEQVPVLSRLARQFAVSDRWHASAPCQTWPNRFFMHMGTAGGFPDNEPFHLLDDPTIFGRLTKQFGLQSWAIYYHDYALALNMRELWQYPLNFFVFDAFLNDARSGKLPAYSFIEPRYIPDLLPPNDQHPPLGVAEGEQLIATVYNALRQGPAWTSTLLLILYDEHGGCFDHAAPPAATPPDDSKQLFAFDRFGVRVPAVIVSPYIKSGVTMRPPPSGPPFDHTSVLATLRNRFGLGAPLTKRDAAAPDLASAADTWLQTPDNMGPERIDAVVSPDIAAITEDLRQKPADDLQRSILHIHANLPTGERPVSRHVELQRGNGTRSVDTSRVTAADAARTARELPERLNKIGRQ